MAECCCIVELGATVPAEGSGHVVCEQRSWPTLMAASLCGLPGLALQLSQELGSCVFQGSKMPEYLDTLFP